MPQEVSSSLKDLIVRFVETYSSVPDLELDLYLNPKPWFMPLNSEGAKREAAHYFLLAAALSDYQLTGNPRNIQLLLSHLSEAFDVPLRVLGTGVGEPTRRRAHAGNLDRPAASASPWPHEGPAPFDGCSPKHPST